MMEIIFENKISVEDFNFLRKSVGWDEVEDALAKNRESFYKQFGFEERPNEKVGAGMSQTIEYE